VAGVVVRGGWLAGWLAGVVVRGGWLAGWRGVALLGDQQDMGAVQRMIKQP
jgi:hypothetical protein